MRRPALALAVVLSASPAAPLTVLTGSVRAKDGVEIHYEAAGNGEPALESLIDYDEAEALAAVKAPLRLINSDRWPTDLAAARRHKPDVELAVMPGLGHFPMLEDPAEFNRLLERALAELAAR